MRAATPDPASGGKPDTAAQPRATATLPVTANAQPAANTSARKVLVDDTVTDAQLKQILKKGYKPESQARDNEVYYCRSERELGSRFETKICRTAARILEEERQGKEVTTRIEQTGGNKPGK
jgi:ribulose bisphosphate carboxylase small subunit